MEYDHTPAILVVDDEPSVCGLVCRALGSEGYRCYAAADGGEAIEMLQEQSFDLVVSDVAMPGMSGIDLLTHVHDERLDVGVVMITGMEDREVAIKALELGAYGYVFKPFKPTEIVVPVKNALRRLQLERFRVGYEQELEQTVEERTAMIRRREEEIALRLLSAAQYRDEETGAHIRRIGRYSAAMAERLGWSKSDAYDLRLAAPMHDIGKLGIPDSILLKPDKLTRREFEIMKRHTSIGARILSESDVPLLHNARRVALYHHERWDASGYPKGLAEEEIPLEGRIVGIVDVYDALVHDRVYHSALPEDEAVQIMSAERGKHFDPRLFDVFLDVLPKFNEIRRRYRDEQDDALRALHLGAIRAEHALRPPSPADTLQGSRVPSTPGSAELED